MYTEKRHAVATVGAGTVKVTTATGDAVLLYRFGTRFKVNRIMALVTTQIANSTANAIVTVYRRPTAGSTAGQVAVGTLSFPDGTKVSKVLYKDVSPVFLNVGEELAFNVSTAGTDASAAAGAFLPLWEGEYTPDTPANESNMLASA